MEQTKTQLLKNVMDQAVLNHEVAGVSALVLEDGDEKFFYTTGHQNIDENKAFARNTICRLYSMSKPITAAAAMLLIQDGVIDYYDRVSKFIPSYAHQEYVIGTDRRTVREDRPMLVRDLLNMTSGLVYPYINTPAEIGTDNIYKEIIDRFDSGDQMSTMEFASRLGELPLQFEPGTHFQYGTSADVLGAVIEAASGMSFGEFLKKRIFEPLHMNDTGFYVPEEKMDRYAQTYICQEGVDGSFAPYAGNNLGIRDNGHENAFESGGAGLFSTIDDYANFARMLIHDGEFEGQQIMTPGTVQFFRGAKLLDHQQADLNNWTGLEGFSYGNLMRIMVHPERASIIGEMGEYGWDGWLGPYFCNAPESRRTFLMMTQRTDYGTGNLTRKLHNIVFS